MARTSLPNGSANDTTFATTLTDPTLPSLSTPSANAATAQPNAEPNPTSSPQATEDDAPEADKPSKKRKRKERLHVLHQATLKRGQWKYFHLELLTPSALPTTSQQPASAAPTAADEDTTMLDSSALITSTPRYPPPPSSEAENDLDPITASTLLAQPLSQYLGLTGSAIPIDILKTREAEVWIRTPRDDAKAFRACLSGWIGSCEKGLVPGGGEREGGERRVRVAWRVRGEGEYVGGLGMGAGADGGGRDLFGD